MNYNEQLQLLIKNALQEDIGDGDHSTLCCIDANAKGKAVLKIKEDGILAGVEVAHKIFMYLQPDIIFTQYKNDGEAMKYGDVAFDVQANVHTILFCSPLIYQCIAWLMLQCHSYVAWYLVPIFLLAK